MLVETTTAEGFIIQGKDVRGVKLCFQEESFEASRQAVLEIPNGPVNLVAFHMNHIFTHSIGHTGKSDAALARPKTRIGMFNHHRSDSGNTGSTFVISSPSSDIVLRNDT